MLVVPLISLQSKPTTRGTVQAHTTILYAAFKWSLSQWPGFGWVLKLELDLSGPLVGLHLRYHTPCFVATRQGSRQSAPAINTAVLRLLLARKFRPPMARQPGVPTRGRQRNHQVDTEQQPNMPPSQLTKPLGGDAGLTALPALAGAPGLGQTGAKPSLLNSEPDLVLLVWGEGAKYGARGFWQWLAQACSPKTSNERPLGHGPGVAESQGKMMLDCIYFPCSPKTDRC